MFFVFQSYLAAFATSGEKTVAAVMSPKNDTVSHISKTQKNVFPSIYLYLNGLLFLSKACSINLFSADTGRRHLDTTIIYHMDPNGGKPNRVRTDAEGYKLKRL